MIYSTQPPTTPGWYWCRNDCDESPAGAEFICHVFRYRGSLWCSWMTAPGQAALMEQRDWSRRALWAGPIQAPADTEE